MRYPFVLLDVGETLLAPRESFAAVYAHVLSEIGFVRPVEVFETALRESWEEMSRVVPSGVDRYGHFPGGEADYWMRFASLAIERAGSEPLAPAFAEKALSRLREAFRDPASWQVYPEVRPALEALRSSGARLAVVSNWDSRLTGLLEDLELTAYFDAIVVSHEVGIEKPAPAIFRRAVQDLGADRRRTLHVGDVPELDLAGASAAGIDGILVDRWGRYPGSAPRMADLSFLPGIVHSGLTPADGTGSPVES